VHWIKKSLSRLSGVRSVPLMPWVPVIILAVFIIIAIFAPLIAPHDPDKVSLPERFTDPVFSDDGSSDHLLGTDHLGRDILSRIIYGARISLSIAGISIAIAATFGTVIGLMSAYYRGWVDAVLMRLVDVTLSIPLILIAIVFAVTLGASYTNVVIIFAALNWPRYARQIRGEALVAMQQDYVALARVAGCSPARIMAKHIFPNVVPTLLVLSTLQVSFLILLEASLSFLGVGIPPPTASWGSMISEGRQYLESFVWLSLFPGVAMTLVVLSMNFFGDWLRDRLDPKLRQV